MFQLPIVDSWYNMMRGSSERNRSSFYTQLSALSTSHGLKSTNNTIQYFYSLTQDKYLTENAFVDQLKTMDTTNSHISPRGFTVYMDYSLCYSMGFGKINKNLLSMRVLF